MNSKAAESTQVVNPGDVPAGTYKDGQKQWGFSPEIPKDAIKVFEPTLKDPMDQLNHTLERIDELNKPAAPSENYVGAFSPESDQWQVDTGNSSVTQTESLRNLFSTGPELAEENGDVTSLLLWAGIIVLGIYLYNRSTK